MRNNVESPRRFMTDTLKIGCFMHSHLRVHPVYIALLFTEIYKEVCKL